MGITKEELNLRVVVRRMAGGSTPYGWAVNQAEPFAPLHISSERFRGMEAAYKAGHIWLADYLSSRQASTSKRRRSRWDDAEALMDDEPQVPRQQIEDGALEQQRVASIGSAGF
jgi:hypothetical protein